MVFVLEHVVVRILALIRLNVHRLNDGKQMIEVRRHGGGRKREREDANDDFCWFSFCLPC